MRKWKELTQKDCEEIKELLIDWAYRGMYGNGESPATERQIEYIKKLGGIPTNGITKIQASKIIKKLVLDNAEY